MPNKRYPEVLRKYGKAGFGRPETAPREGSFPMYPISRARYGLVLLATPGFDDKKKVRTQVSKRILKAHPSLKPLWKRLSRTINTRMGVVEPDWSTLKVTKVFGQRLARNPRRYGRAPARGHAEAAMRRDGFYDFEYDKKGTIPGRGPVLAYTAYDTDGVEHRVNVGRIRGTDALEGRAISIDRFSR